MMTFEERPESPDWEWFMCDLARAMKRNGFSIECVDLFTYEEVKRYPTVKKDLSKAEWLKNYFGNYLNLDRLKGDWGEYLRGEKGLKTFTAQYCRDSLFRGNVSTSDNAHALSDSLKEELPKELERYRKAKRTTMEIGIEESECCVKQELAAQYLGYKDSRSIRYLADHESPKLSRCKKHSGGKITVSSLVTRKRELASKK